LISPHLFLFLPALLPPFDLLGALSLHFTSLHFFAPIHPPTPNQSHLTSPHLQSLIATTLIVYFYFYLSYFLFPPLRPSSSSALLISTFGHLLRAHAGLNSASVVLSAPALKIGLSVVAPLRGKLVSEKAGGLRPCGY
jgi:hypothetical protein